MNFKDDLFLAEVLDEDYSTQPLVVIWCQATAPRDCYNQRSTVAWAAINGAPRARSMIPGFRQLAIKGGAVSGVCCWMTLIQVQSRDQGHSVAQSTN